MTIIIGSDQAGFVLKNEIKDYLKENDLKVIDVTEVPAADFIDSVEKIVNELKKDKTSLGLAFDQYGAGSFIAATKHKGIIAAEVSDERSAYMTREHNNSTLITIGSDIVGKELAKNIVNEFIKGSYEAGRHQIRVDMLNKMR
ncbi:galactose-6-phosphate isomerase subunit LacA [Enterococcus sp. LJL98]